MTAAVLAEPLTPEWFARRRLGIGASEIAAVMGISPWESPFSLYWRKVNGWEFDATPEMEWGTRLEPVLAQKYADSHPDTYVDTAGIGSNGQRLGGLAVGPEPWMLATPDRYLAGACDHRARDPYGCSDCMNTGQSEPIGGVLELKAAHNADGWGEPGTDDIPVHYRAQVQWQMLVVDVTRADVAVLIGGSDYREYAVRRDNRDIRVMVEHGRRFMGRLDRGEPPPLDEHSATLATVRRLHPDMDRDTEAAVPDAVAAGYRRAVRMARLADRAKGRYEALIRDAMGRAHKAVAADGSKVATRVIAHIDEHPVKAHSKDYLLPPREKK